MDLSVMVGDTKFNYRAGLLIIKGNKVLVECNPDIDFVVFPGGRIKTRESSIEGLKRELKEEMNIEVEESEISMIGVIENFFEMDGKNYHELFFLYKLVIEENDTRFKEKMINYDSKASFYKWVDKDKLKEENLLKEVLRNINPDDTFNHFIVK